MEKTKVIFRKYPDGEIIALFPQIATTATGWLCQSYLHVGQHGGAMPSLVVSQTKPAYVNDKGYMALNQELERMGYDLVIAKKFTRKDFEIRRSQYN